MKQLKYNRFDKTQPKQKSFGSYQLQTRFRIRILAKVPAPNIPEIYVEHHAGPSKHYITFMFMNRFPMKQAKSDDGDSKIET